MTQTRSLAGTIGLATGILLLAFSVAHTFALGALTRAELSLDTRVQGAQSTATLTIELANDLPADGQVIVDFPSAFGVLNVSDVSSSDISGGLTYMVAAQRVTIQRDGTGEAMQLGHLINDLTIVGLNNPPSTGHSQAYTISTADSQGGLIDRGTANAHEFIAYQSVPAVGSSMEILSPNGGETLMGTTLVDIVLGTTGSSIDHYSIDFSTDNGRTYTSVATNVPFGETFAWEVPNQSVPQAQLRVRAFDSVGTQLHEDVANAPFIIVTTLEVDEIDQEPVVVNDLPAGFSRLEDYMIGNLIKSVNSPTVYYYGEDHRRHPFPDETTFYSWFENFDGVRVLEASDMAQLLLGSRVTIRPGTHLIKTQSSDDVYAIEPGGVRRLIPDETMARKMYGDDWTNRVVDVSVAFFGDYRYGPPLSGQYPDGTVVRVGPDRMYIDNGVQREISALGHAKHRFQSRFEVVTSSLSLPFGPRVINLEKVIARIFPLTK